MNEEGKELLGRMLVRLRVTTIYGVTNKSVNIIWEGRGKEMMSL